MPEYSYHCVDLVLSVHEITYNVYLHLYKISFCYFLSSIILSRNPLPMHIYFHWNICCFTVFVNSCNLYNKKNTLKSNYLHLQIFCVSFFFMVYSCVSVCFVLSKKNPPKIFTFFINILLICCFTLTYWKIGESCIIVLPCHEFSYAVLSI